MTKSQPFRVGIVGLGPQGRDLLERLSLLPHCEMLLYQTPAEKTQNPVHLPGMNSTTDWHRFLSESELNAVLFLNGSALDPATLQAALSTSLSVGVLPPLVGEVSRWQRLASAERVLVLNPHSENPDFRAALAWSKSKEAGPLRAVKRVSWVPDLIEPPAQHRSPDGWFSQWLWDDVDQLLRLTGTLPKSVYAMEYSPDAPCYCLLLTFAEGVVAHLERRRSSAVPLELGWTLTGPAGGYANNRRYITTEAGEIYDVPADPPPLEGDPLFARLTTLGPSAKPDSSWGHALDVLRVQHTILQSAQTGQVVQC